MQPSFGDVEVNGIAIRYARWGDDGAGKPPLLLSHATGFCAMVWRLVAEGLSGRYDVYALDRRGHGASPSPRGGQAGVERYDFATFAADLTAFVEALGLKDVYGVGHSSGATDTLLAAADRPNSMSRVLALEPIIPLPEWRGSGPSPPQLLAERARRRRSNFESRAAARARWASREPFERWDSRVLDDYVEYGLEERSPGAGVGLRCPPEVEAAMFAASAAFDPLPDLARVRCPVLVADGERSGGDFARMADAAAGAIPGAGRYTFPDATHFLPMERPEAVVGKVLEFGEPG